MARLFHVKKARKSQGKCHKCGKPIKSGTPYKYADKRISGHGFASIRYKWHAGCEVRRSELMSGFAASVMAIQESLDEELSAATSIEDVKSALENAESSAEELASETREKFDNMPEGLQQGNTGELLSERADSLDEWVSELSNAAANLEDEPEEGITVEDHLEQQREEAREAGDSFQG